MVFGCIMLNSFINMDFSKKIRNTIKVSFFEFRWSMVRIMSEILTPYRHPGSVSHRLITGLFHALLSKTEYADKDFLEALQTRRLQRLLRCAQKIPWWKERFDAYDINPKDKFSLKNLEKLPPVSKDNFLAVKRECLTQRFPYVHERMLNHRTSGTTGVPFEWGIDKNLWLVEVTAYFYRALSRYGAYTQYEKFMIAALVYKSYSVPSKEICWNPIGINSHKDFISIMKDLKKAKCSVLFSYPTNLLLFAKEYKSSKESLPLRIILTTGQRLEDEYRFYVEKYMSCRVVSLYGAREFGQMAVECPARQHWYHVNTERILLEVLNEAGDSVPDGKEGLLTITGLDNYTMPLVRYQLGDRGKICIEKCPCGNNLQIIEFQGREIGFIMLPNGERVPFRHINSLFLNLYFDIFSAYQVEQLELVTLVVRYRLCQHTSEDFKERLRHDIQKSTCEEMTVRFEEMAVETKSSMIKAAVFIPLKTK